MDEEQTADTEEVEKKHYVDAERMAKKAFAASAARQEEVYHRQPLALLGILAEIEADGSKEQVRKQQSMPGNYPERMSAILRTIGKSTAAKTKSLV